MSTSLHMPADIKARRDAALERFLAKNPQFGVGNRSGSRPGHVGRAPLNPDRFPDWGLVVPQPSKTPFRVKAKDLRAAIRACRINDRKVESKGVRFLIDEDGLIQAVWRKVRVKDHASEVLAAAKGA